MKTKQLTIKGLVQGIGFRPFVAEIAEELNIKGFVRNSGGIVTIVASYSDDSLLDKFKDIIKAKVPTGGFISEIIEQEISSESYSDFQIINSNEDESQTLPFMPADIATCPRCQKELFDKANRRYLHPFISCTLCGPRYSILKELPYDRDTITMGSFELCPECSREYVMPKNIRRHAQTIACNFCGPKLFLEFISDGEVNSITTDIVEKSVSFLKEGGILAIKDIGGFHLACDPNNEQALVLLRKLKHREAKSFAVLFDSTKTVMEYCNVNDKERELLESSARPIVLLRKKKDGKAFDYQVSLNSPDIGAMLCCNPLQILLTKEMKTLVMTSGNGSGDTLEIDNNAMREWLINRSKDQELREIKLGLLYNDRDILRPLDDSVMRVVAGRQMFVRRARGYVPNPIATNIKGEIFAAGGDLKSSFCYVKNGFAYVSQYLGDLQNISCQRSYRKERDAMEKIFGFKPEIKVTDMHPGYVSRTLVEGEIQVQHHMAHVASVIAEYGLEGDVLGFAFDGTGYGTDGAIWGGEVMRWTNNAMERVAHIKPVTLVGGDEGAKNCQTIFEGYLYSLGLGASDTITAKAIDMGVNTVKSTSMGRLFDAVSYLLGISDRNDYEGQAAIELENVAATTEEYFPLVMGEDGDTTELFAGLLLGVGSSIPIEKLARGFIYAIADYILEQAIKYNIKQVVFSGGTFLNKILTERAVELLEEKGFEVYIPQQLPVGDGGICLGQAKLSQ